jgi:hypothetical protein
MGLKHEHLLFTYIKFIYLAFPTIIEINYSSVKKSYIDIFILSANLKSD